MKFTGTDKRFMNKALALAQIGGSRVFPNPKVGAVIVKDGKVLGKGFHRYFGGPHAEIYALSQAGKSARGATLYVTLEPCAHWGKTPPCADMIIKSGIARVVAACEDPNPITAGHGFRKLYKYGIKVEKGLMRKESMRQNSDYFERFKPRTGLVTVKAAMSLDGKICTRTGDSKWISGRRSRDLVHLLRSRYDAVLVGINTVLKDNPKLTSHGRGKNPARVVIDPELKIPLNSIVLDGQAPTIIFTNNELKVKLAALRKRGVIVILNSIKGNINFKYILKELNKMSIYSILIEGGGETIASAMEAGIVADIMLFLAPIIIGGRDAKTPVEGTGVARVLAAGRVAELKVKRIGQDLLLTGRVL